MKMSTKMSEVWNKLQLRKDIIALFIKSQVLCDGEELVFLGIRFTEINSLLSQEADDIDEAVNILYNEFDLEDDSVEAESYFQSVRQFLTTIRYSSPEEQD